MPRLLVCFWLAALLHLSTATTSEAYSVLTHQAVIDSAWRGSLVPVLLKRFPGSTPGQLQEAHAYAYGGSIIQDMGYYPLSRKLFTNLTHHVRSGSFVHILINEAENLNELAFGLGALAHYYADVIGHPMGTNQVVPLMYPKYKKEFGDTITYEEKPVAHKQTEFAFDILFLADGHYAPDSFRTAIGFRVPKKHLERSFKACYGLEARQVFFSYSLAVGTYRRMVSLVIPELVDVAWHSRKNKIEETRQQRRHRRDTQRISADEYEERWGSGFEEPGLIAKIFGLIFRYLPKIGPLRMFAMKVPDPQSEQIFKKSFSETLLAYRQALKQLENGKQPPLPETNFDTGNKTEWEEYVIADKTYKKLLRKLYRNDFEQVSNGLQQHLLSYYRTDNKTQPLPLEKKQKKHLRKLKAHVPPVSKADEKDAPKQ